MEDKKKNYYSESDPLNFLAKYLNPQLEKINPVIEKELPILDRLGINSNFRIPEISRQEREEQLNEAMSPENLVMGMGLGGLLKSSVLDEVAKKFGGKKVAVPKLDESLSKKLASEFKNLKHNPESPDVQKAYKALVDETRKQYDELQKVGLKVSPIRGENPYKTSKDLHADFNKNSSISYYPTELGYGTSPISKTNVNPLLDKSGRYDSSGNEMLNNDLFRVVHDAFGHVKPETGFGKLGEEAAYQSHKSMYSPEAIKALTTETRGQNSYVNFGPNAAHNKANSKDTIYADQKLGLMPDWTSQGGNVINKESMSPNIQNSYESLRKLLKGDD